MINDIMIALYEGKMNSRKFRDQVTEIVPVPIIRTVKEVSKKVDL